MRFLRYAAAFLLALLLTVVLLSATMLVTVSFVPHMRSVFSDLLSAVPVVEGLAELIPALQAGPEPEEKWDLQNAAAQQTSGSEEDSGGEAALSPVFYPYYAMLDEEEREVYIRLYESISSRKETVNFGFRMITEEQFSRIWEAVQNDHPELFWLKSECTYSINGFGAVTGAVVSFYEFPEGWEAASKRFLSASEEILNEASRLESDYEKEVYIHDAVARLICYDTEAEYSQSAYSALAGSSSVCAGYSRAFQYLLMQCGIPCYYCTGTCGGSHAWNLVMLDGEYYNVDLTWDDACSSYDFFNRTDTDFAFTHTRTGMSLLLPACSGEKYRNTAAMPEATEPDFTGRGRGEIRGQPPGAGGNTGPGPGIPSGGFSGPGKGFRP